MRNTITHNHQAALDVFTTQWLAALAGEAVKPLGNSLVKILPPNGVLYDRDTIKKAEKQNAFQSARDIRGTKRSSST